MADLTVLIRLHKHELDEKRRALGELYTAMAELGKQRQELQRAFDKEKAAVANTGLDLSKAKLLLGNYPTPSMNGALKPFEAVVLALN